MTNLIHAARATGGADDPYYTTILVRSDDVECTLHDDGSAVDIGALWTLGTPGIDDTNHHPNNVNATKWARCTTCQRLFLRMPSFATTSGSAVLSVAQTVFVTSPTVETTYLNEADPTVNYVGNAFQFCGGDSGSGVRRHPLFQITPQALPHSRARIIGAGLKVLVNQITGTASYDAYIGLQDVDANNATWNVYDTALNWGTAGALQNDVDRDTTKKLATASVVTDLVWRDLFGSDSDDFRDAYAAGDPFNVLLYFTGTGSDNFRFKGAQAATEGAELYYVYDVMRKHRGNRSAVGSRRGSKPKVQYPWPGGRAYGDDD